MVASDTSVVPPMKVTHDLPGKLTSCVYWVHWWCTYLLDVYDAGCTYLLNAYDAKTHQGYSVIREACSFVPNRDRANPNTSPDSPSNGESGEVFGFTLHLFFTKFLGGLSDESTLVHFCMYAFRG